jgi:MYXO-CTERM domain-containing protein
VRRVRASPDGDQWVVDTPTGGFVRVSGRWDEGWKATVDGRHTDVLRADGIFRGVVVPAGHHTVRFSYSDPDAARGLKVAAAALLVIAGLFLLSFRRRQPSDADRRAPRSDVRTGP